MAFSPIAFVAPNYRDYKNWWLKAYEPGTTTPKVMADNISGNPTVAKYEINKDGFIVSSGGTLTIPFVDGDYDVWLFPTEAEADSNDTVNALRLADDLSSPGSVIGGFSTYVFDTVSDAKAGTTIGGTSVTLKVNDVITIKERGNAVFDVVSGVANVNGYDIIQHDTLSLSYQLRVGNECVAEQFGVVFDNESLVQTDVMQRVIDVALTDPEKPLPIKLNKGGILIDDDLVIISKITGSQTTNFGMLKIYCNGSNGVFGGSVSECRFLCNTTGVNIFRISEEQPASIDASGAFPGGGAGVVTEPLRYLRTVMFEGISFVGEATRSVNAIVGRGVTLSVFKRCGFHNLNFAIRLGKAFATSQEQSLDGFDLDYCERNTFENCFFNNTKYHTHVLQGDTNRHVQCTHNPLPDASGLFHYYAGGNDTYLHQSCIYQANYNNSGTKTDLDHGIKIIGGRNYVWSECHVENQKGRFIDCLTQRCDVITFEGGLFLCDGVINDRVFSLFLNPDGLFKFDSARVVTPSYGSGFFWYLIDNTQTVKTIVDKNRITDALTSDTVSTMKNNLTALDEGQYSWTDPIATNTGEYLFVADNKLRSKSGSKPTSETDGDLIGSQADVEGTLSFPGVSVSAGSGATVTGITAVGATVGSFVSVASDEVLGSLLYSVNPTSGSVVSINFYNPTGGTITIASGTWKFRVYS